MISVIGGELYQYDAGRKVQVVSKKNYIIEEVHFCNEDSDTAFVCHAIYDDSVATASIPNILLQSTKDLIVYAVVTTEDSKQTLERGIFHIYKRKRPDDYVYTETDVFSYKALEQYIKNEIKEIKDNVNNGSLVQDAVVNYLKENPVDVPTKVSELENDSGYILQETDPTVPSWAKQDTKPSYTANEVGADSVGTAQTKVDEHNVNAESHNDIRLLIEGLTSRLNALADSDDATLDQMSEVVSYIKSNKSLIDSITTGKVSVSDIVDNLTTNVANKPLSAKQGVALKALIDAIIIPTALAQLSEDATHKTVTDKEKETWNNKLNQSDLQNGINTALAQAKESGEFNGQDGQDGQNGSDGYSPIAKVEKTDDGVAITITDKSGTTTANVKNGVDGQDGYTPVKGIDYFDGDKGDAGAKGADGISVTHTWNGTTLIVNSASGTSSADLKGDKGESGEQGIRGEKGESGVYVGNKEPDDPNVNVWVNPDGDSTNTVLYSPQNLTEEQKAQARSNIGVVEGEYELIDRIVLGYELLTKQPADWATNYGDYYTWAETTLIQCPRGDIWYTNPVYKAVEFEPFRILTMNKEPDGTPYNFSKMIAIAYIPPATNMAASSSGSINYSWGNVCILTLPHAHGANTYWAVIEARVENGFVMAKGGNTASKWANMQMFSPFSYRAMKPAKSLTEFKAQMVASDVLFSRGTVYEIWGVRAK